MLSHLLTHLPSCCCLRHACKGIFHSLTPTFVQNEQYRAKVKQSNERSLALIKAAMDIVVAVGLLQLAPKKVTPRVTGAFGFVTSLISCYQVTVKSMPSS